LVGRRNYHDRSIKALRGWASGINDYATLIHPALEAAVQEKRSATAAPAQAA